MAYDVSVLIPAFEAADFIGRAIRSVQWQEGVSVQVVIGADDGTDYLACLAAQDIGIDNIVQCRTAKPQSGPSLARNAALAIADAQVIATLDADDEYAEERLAPLVAAASRHGFATGPTVELESGQTKRIGRPRDSSDRLNLADLCELRMPFAPVFRRELAPRGWPDLSHAEDLVFNIELMLAAGHCAFVDSARYLYHRRRGSLSDSLESLERSERGYLQILSYLDNADWPYEVRRELRTVIQDDLDMVRSARRDNLGQSWRDVWNIRATGQVVPDPVLDPRPKR